MTSLISFKRSVTSRDVFAREEKLEEKNSDREGRRKIMRAGRSSSAVRKLDQLNPIVEEKESERKKAAATLLVCSFEIGTSAETSRDSRPGEMRKMRFWVVT